MPLFLTDLGTLEPYVRVCLSLAVALTVFNTALGFIPASDDLARKHPFWACVLPGIAAGWALKSCFFMLTSLRHSDVAFQVQQLVLLAILETAAFTLFYRSMTARTVTDTPRRPYLSTYYPNRQFR